MSKPELLAPAGDMEKLRVAFNYGADAVYVGGKDFSLRAAAGNFTMEELAEAADYAHSFGKKLYLAVNIFARNEDLKALPDYLRQAASARVDALIVSDLGVFDLARQYAPVLPLHISTQANNVNWQSAAMWARLGAQRVILGRELSLAEATQISALSGLETEYFVHGAMCMAYSGRCLMSSFFTGRDANRGDCAQPCRWRYTVQEEQRPGEYMSVEEDARGSYIFNSKDLCLIDALPQLLTAGISALKIEGRNKSAYYIANVTRVYRQAIDAVFAEGEGFSIRNEWREELAKISHREYTQGFAFAKTAAQAQRYTSSDPVRGYDFVAIAQRIEAGWLVLEQRNHFEPGDKLELLLPPPCGGHMDLPVTELYNEQGQKLSAAVHPRQTVFLPLTEGQRQKLKPWAPPLVLRRPARIIK
ncbi:MAG: U32 family peptidase [Clostridiales bacterium]|nr:U32 family peptidase [Clostridiales bacterium]